MGQNSDKVWIAIAAYNEEKIIGEVIKEIRSAGYSNIIVVDDGSADRTYEEARKNGARAFRHKINRGKGAAAKTAMEAGKLLGADVIVTMDADGQHDPQDIKYLIEPIIRKECDATLGTRLLNPAGMPWYKILQNKFGNFITWCLYGLWVTDSQSGFRAYSRHSAEKIDTKADRYEYDSEIIREICIRKLRYKEIPIKVRYTDYSMGKIQKQSFWNGLRTVYKMVWNLIT